MKRQLVVTAWILVGASNYSGFVGYHHDLNRRLYTDPDQIAFLDRSDRAVALLTAVAGPLALPAIWVSTGFYYRGFAY